MDGLEMFLVLGLLAGICVLVPWLLVLLVLPVTWWAARGVRLRSGL